MKSLAVVSLVLAIAVTVLSPLSAKDEKTAWLTNYPAALELAAKEKRPVLVDFTGSDWCGWCIRLDKETFSQAAFLKFAEKNLVLLKIDLPQSKPQSAEEKAQNEELVKKFNVEGFPTIVLLGADGKEIARQGGYLPGGPAAMIDWIKSSAKL